MYGLTYELTYDLNDLRLNILGNEKILRKYKVECSDSLVRNLTS